MFFDGPLVILYDCRTFIWVPIIDCNEGNPSLLERLCVSKCLINDTIPGFVLQADLRRHLRQMLLFLSVGTMVFLVRFLNPSGKQVSTNIACGVPALTFFVATCSITFQATGTPSIG